MRLTFFFITVLCCNFTFAQKRDTIFTYNESIVCKIKEVADENVKFSYPNEDILVSINKNRIRKITYSSGRQEVFVESSSYKAVEGWQDWEKVLITNIEAEVDGLYKLGDVSSKAKAGTVLANLNKIKNKAIRKIKIRAAMLGANVVYLLNDHTKGHHYQPWSDDCTETAEVLLTGVAYSNRSLNIDEFKKVVESRNTFRLKEIVQMPFNRKRPTVLSGRMRPVDLSDYKIEGFHVFVEFEKKKYRVIACDSEEVILMRQGKRRTYNYILR